MQEASGIGREITAIRETPPMTDAASPSAPQAPQRLGKLLDLPGSDLREWLWVNHGHPVTTLYGDDGEMQCGMCPAIARDYKRAPLEFLLRAYADAQRAEVARLTALVDEIRRVLFTDNGRQPFVPNEGLLIDEVKRAVDAQATLRQREEEIARVREQAWNEALDKAIALVAHYMVPGHWMTEQMSAACRDIEQAKLPPSQEAADAE